MGIGLANGSNLSFMRASTGGDNKEPLSLYMIATLRCHTVKRMKTFDDDLLFCDWLAFNPWNMYN